MSQLERVLEPEVMDTEQEAIDYDAMDHSEVNRIFVDDLLAAGFTGGDVLDVGTGTALIPIELAKRLDELEIDDFRLMAVDAAAHMLETARYNLAIHEIYDKIQLSQEDAKATSFPDEMFDCVISNSIIHHIPEPDACVAEMVRVCKPGGLLFVRDLMRPESDEQVRQIVQTYAGDENEHSQKMFDDSLRAALTVEEMSATVGKFGFSAETVNANSDRHWTWIGRKNSS